MHIYYHYTLIKSQNWHFTWAFLPNFSTNNGFNKKRVRVENEILSIILEKLVVAYFQINKRLESMVQHECFCNLCGISTLFY